MTLGEAMRVSRDDTVADPAVLLEAARVIGGLDPNCPNCQLVEGVLTTRARIMADLRRLMEDRKTSKS